MIGRPAPANALEEHWAPDLPTQAGLDGIRFDFNEGARVALPASETAWRVRITNTRTATVLHDGLADPGSLVNPTLAHYQPLRIEVYAGTESPVFVHDYSARDRDILIQFPANGLGDTISWISATERFRQHHQCRLTVMMRQHFIDFFAPVYPDITFRTATQVDPAEYYATYKIMLYYNDHGHDYQFFDYQSVPLHHVAAYILGLPPDEVPPLLSFSADTPPLDQPYVCIAVQASGQLKTWCNPEGWRDVVSYLNAHGLRVVCIDQKSHHANGLIITQMPTGCQDETGNRPLAERARWLRHAAAFIGVSSGLSWLAWAAGTPVVMISGFTHPLNEFYTPYRVINWHTCNSCWNDVALSYDTSNSNWCPRHAGTPRQFECSRLITSQHVTDTLSRIPQLIGHDAR